MSIFPFTFQETVPEAETRKASLWSARLLHFTSFLESSTNLQNPVKGTTLTILSELETDTFLVEMLAYCFPVSAKSHVNDDKLDRIMSQLRCTLGADSTPLSVHYQARSREIVMQRQNLGANNGQFYELLLMKGSDYLIDNNALQVGSFLFEYDLEYIVFIDNTFSVLFPEKNIETTFISPRESLLLSVSQSSHMHSSKDIHNNLPLLSQFLADVKQEQEKVDTSCWEKVLPLLELLHTWTLSTVVPSSVPPPRKRRSRSKTPENEPETVASLKVNLSPNLVIECLKQREEDHLSKSQSILQTKNTTKVCSISVVEECCSKENINDSVESQCCASGSVSGPPLLIQLPPGTLKVHVRVRTYVNITTLYSLCSCSV